MLKIFAAIILIIFSSSSLAEQSCPIVISKVNPRAYPFTAGMLSGIDKDPWDKYLQVEYTNKADKTSVAIKFGVYFMGAMREAKQSVYSYSSDETAKPGQTKKPYWSDGVYYHEYGMNLQAMVWVEKVRFADGTYWTDDGTQSCGNVRFEDQKTYAPNPTSGISQQSNPEASPVVKRRPGGENPSASSAPNMLSSQQQLEMVSSGQGSRTVVTSTPSGADLLIDGKKVGVTPMVFILLRKPNDAERTIEVTMPGYKPYQVKLKPNGTSITLPVSLQPETLPAQ